MARKVTNTAKAGQRKPSSTQKESSRIKHTKPVFGTGTLITVLVLAGLIVFTFYLNKQKQSTVGATPTNQTSFVFTKADGNPTSIEVKPASEQTFKLSRDAKNVWAIDLPSKAEANQGLAEAAATQVSALKVISSINADPAIFGLDKPAYIITIEFDGGKKHVLEIGDSTPSSSGYYVRLDNNKMLITDLSGIDSLIKLGVEPPYLNTPRPSPVPPTTGASAPGATVTPTP